MPCLIDGWIKFEGSGRKGAMMRFRDYGLAMAGAAIWLAVVVGRQARYQPAPVPIVKPVSQNVDEPRVEQSQIIDVPLPSGPFRGISQTVVIDGRGIVSASITYLAVKPPSADATNHEQHQSEKHAKYVKGD